MDDLKIFINANLCKHVTLRKKWSQNPGAILENGAILEGGAVFSLIIMFLEKKMAPSSEVAPFPEIVPGRGEAVLPKAPRLDTGCIAQF